MTEDDENSENERVKSSHHTIRRFEKQAFDNNNNMNRYKNIGNNSQNLKNEEINPFINDVLEKLTSMQKFQV